MLTIKELLIFSSKKTLDSDILLSYVIKKPKSFLYTHPETKLNKFQIKKFKQLVKKRSEGVPVAYLTSQKEFFGLNFFVNKNVLIPRPETETLVELALSVISKQKTVNRILDLGTGSGCIIISLAKMLNNFSTRQVIRPDLVEEQGGPLLAVRARPSFSSWGVENYFYASDISAKALAVAKKNAKKHKAKVTFKQGSLLDPWKNQHFDIIVANLPYLAKLENPSTKFEPRNALIASKQGIGLYERLFKQISSLREVRSFDPTTKQSQPWSVFVEFDPRQASKIKNLANKFLPEYKITFQKDLSGRTRFALVQKSSLV